MRRSGRVPERPSPTISAAIQGKSLRFDVFGPPSVFRIEESQFRSRSHEIPSHAASASFSGSPTPNNGTKRLVGALMHMSRRADGGRPDGRRLAPREASDSIA